MENSYIFTDVVQEAVLLELDILEDEDLKKVIEILQNVKENGPAMFTTAMVAMTLGGAVNNHVSFRHFSIGLLERIELLAYVNQTRLLDSHGNYRFSRWFRDIAESISHSRKHGLTEDSIIADDVRQALFIKEETTKTLYENNPWLIAIYVAVFTGAAEKAVATYQKKYEDNQNAKTIP